MADSGGSPAANFFERLKAYVRTRKGTILTAEILISFIILICYAASLYSGYTSVAICEMIFAIIFLVVFTMELDKQFQIISWPWSDLIRAVIGALLYLITSIICLIGGGGDGPRIAGGVFGLLAGVLFGYDSYTIYMQIKGGGGHTAAPTDEGV